MHNTKNELCKTPFPKQSGVCWCLALEAECASQKALLQNTTEVLTVPLMKSMKWLLACLWQAWCYLGSSEYGSLPSPQTDSLFCSSSGIPHPRTTRCSKLHVGGLLRPWFSAGYCSPGSGFTEVLLDMTPPGEQRGAETLGRVWRKQDSSWFLETSGKVVQQQPPSLRSRGQRHDCP